MSEKYHNKPGMVDDMVGKDEKCPLCGATNPPEDEECTVWFDGPWRTVFCYERERTALKARAEKAEADLKELRITEQEWLDAFAGKNGDMARMVQRCATETMDNRREIERLNAEVARLEAQLALWQTGCCCAKEVRVTLETLAREDD